MNKLRRLLKSEVFLMLALLLVAIIFSNTVTLLISTALVGYFFSLRISRTYFLTTISSTVLGSLVITAAAGVIAILLWALHVSLSLHLILLMACLGAILWCAYDKGALVLTQRADYCDLIALLVVASYVLLTLVGLSHVAPQGKLNPRVYLLQSVTNGIDDISHLMMYQDTVLADKGLLLGSVDKSLVGKESNASYPKLSHTIAAMFHGKIEAKKTNIVFAYAITKFVVFGLTIYVLCRIVLERVTPKLDKLILSALSLPILGFMVIFLINVFVEEGFFSIWPVLLYSPLVLLILGGPAQRKSRLNFLIAGLMISTVTMSWPIMGLPLYAALALHFLNPLNIKMRWREYVLLSTSLIGLIQISVQFFDKGAPISQSEINAPGGIPLFPLMFVVGLGVISLLISIYEIRKTRNVFLATYVMSALAMTTLIGYINLHATGSIQYFYMKSALLMSIIFCVAALPPFLSSLVGFFKKEVGPRYVSALLAFGTGITLSICIPLLFGAQQIVAYAGSYLLAGERHISNSTSRVVLLDNNNLKNTISVSTDRKIENYYTNALIGGLNSFETCQIAAQPLGITTVEETKKSLLKSCTGEKRVRFLIVDDPTIKNEVSCDDVRSLVHVLDDKSPTVDFAYSDECR